MTLFMSNLRRIFKNKVQVLVIIILPVITLFFGSTYVFSNDQDLTMGISDLDKTDFTRMFINCLASQVQIVEIPQEQIQDKIINSKIEYAVVINKGFTESLIKGNEVETRGYYLEDANQSLPIQNYVDSYISAAKRIAKASGGNEQKFYEGMDNLNDSNLKLEYKVLTEFEREKSYGILGLFLIFMLMTTVIFTTLILTDKGNKTFYRTLTTPVSLRNYMFQNILSFLVVSVFQVTVMFIVLKGLFGIYLGNSTLNMYLLFLAASLLAVSLGVAISSISKSVIQASFTGLFLAFFLGSIGGCFIENDMSTGLFRTMGKFTPVYWIMDGVSKLLKEKGLSAIGGDILVVILFALVLFFLCTWKKEDIAK